jgi:hypothetical protein
MTARRPRLGGEIRDSHGQPLDKEGIQREIQAIVEKVRPAGFAPGKRSLCVSFERRARDDVLDSRRVFLYHHLQPVARMSDWHWKRDTAMIQLPGNPAGPIQFNVSSQ